MGKDSCVHDDRREGVADLTSSAKLVFTVLEHEGQCTQRQLAQKSRLSQRTVRKAIRALEANDLITSRINFRDTRQHLYSIPVGSETDER